ncbi:MAG: repeat protein [Acidobacteria bacterium]|nr:repeat protein [Acidobacteriota bacterium]
MAGRLRTADTVDGTNTQSRTFTYDGRGFLSGETSPEKTAGVQYSYDARGHVTRSIDGPFDLRYTYDAAERLIAIRSGGVDLKTFTYGATNAPDNFVKGKLLTATRRQTDPALGGDVTVTETYRYNGLGGRVSERTTNISSTASFSGASFTTSLTYDTLGMPSRVGYPQCTAPSACAAAALGRNVDYGYTQGWLTSVTMPGAPSPYASITYQPSGITGTITHTGGLKEQWIDDATSPGRPCAIFAYTSAALITDVMGPCGRSVPAGSAISWTSGVYGYDGAGNITQMGTRRYVYDAVNRLVSEGENVTSTGAKRSLTSLFGYDVFGNMTSQSTAIFSIGPGGADTSTRATQTIAVDAATNRLQAATYDGAGNMLTTDASDAASTYAWDPVGTMRSLTESQRELHFLYSADDERVAVVSHPPLSPPTQLRTTWTLRGVDNKVLREWVDDSTTGTRTWSWSEDEIWRGASILANESPAGTKQYVLDHLGSPRLITDGSGAYLGTNDFSPSAPEAPPAPARCSSPVTNATGAPMPSGRWIICLPGITARGWGGSYR